MTQELQQLLDRIRAEGVEKAEDEAKTILAQARKEADETVAQAKAEAETFKQDAEREADAFTQRAEQSIRQAARDVLIQVEQDLVKSFEALLSREVEATAADEDAFRQWVSDAVTAYLKGGDSEVEVVLGGKAAEQSAGLVEQLRAEAGREEGIEVSSSPAFPNGFTLRLQDGRVEYSFTNEAIVSALSRLLRPQLVKLLSSAE